MLNLHQWLIIRDVILLNQQRKPMGGAHKYGEVGTGNWLPSKVRIWKRPILYKVRGKTLQRSREYVYKMKTTLLGEILAKFRQKELSIEPLAILAYEWNLNSSLISHHGFKFLPLDGLWFNLPAENLFCFWSHNKNGTDW